MINISSLEPDNYGDFDSASALCHHMSTLVQSTACLFVYLFRYHMVHLIREKDVPTTLEAIFC
jgi:hypothetical protein